MKVAKKSKTKITMTALGKIVMVYSKSSNYGIALVEPKFTNIEDQKFLEGIQVTGKANHRMERKRTLIPLDHIASIVEFEAEDDLWKSSQIVPVQDQDSDESEPMPRPNKRPHHAHNNNKFRHKNRRPRYQEEDRSLHDGKLQEQYDASQYRKFKR